MTTLCDSSGEMFERLLKGFKLRRTNWPKHWYIYINDKHVIVDHDGETVMAIDIGDPTKWEVL